MVDSADYKNSLTDGTLQIFIDQLINTFRPTEMI